MSAPREFTFTVTAVGLTEILGQINERSQQTNERNEEINERNHEINERNHEINKRNHDINDRHQQFEQEMNQKNVENHLQSEKILMELAEIKDLLKRQPLPQPVRGPNSEQLPGDPATAAENAPLSSSETLQPDGSIDLNVDYGLRDRADNPVDRAYAQISLREVNGHHRTTSNIDKDLRQEGQSSLCSATLWPRRGHHECRSTRGGITVPSDQKRDKVERPFTEDDEDTDMEDIMPPKRPRLSISPGRRASGRPIKPFSKPLPVHISSSTNASDTREPVWSDKVAPSPSYPAAECSLFQSGIDDISIDEIMRAAGSISPPLTEKKNVNSATPPVQSDAQSANSTPGMDVSKLFRVRTDMEQRQNSRLRNETSWLKSQHEAAGFRAEFTGLTRSQVKRLTEVDTANVGPDDIHIEDHDMGFPQTPAAAIATSAATVTPAAPSLLPAATLTQGEQPTRPQLPAPTAVVTSQSFSQSSPPVRRSGRSAAPAKRYEGYLDTVKVIKGPRPH